MFICDDVRRYISIFQAGDTAISCLHLSGVAEGAPYTGYKTCKTPTEKKNFYNIHKLWFKNCMKINKAT